MGSAWKHLRRAPARLTALGLAMALGVGLQAARADAPPSASPAAIDGVIQSVGVRPSPVGDNTDSLVVLPDGAAAPVTLTVDRPADKQALALGARAGDQVWLTVDDPLKPEHVVQVTRVARPVPLLQKLIALVAALAVVAGLASAASSGAPQKFLLGNDNRLSNSQCQLALWFGVVAVAYGAALILRAWFLGWDFMGGIGMTTNVLAMTGLSGLSFGAAKLVAVNKASAEAAPTVAAAAEVKPAITDLFLNDFGQPDLGDFQMILISGVAALIFAATCWQFLGLLDIVTTVNLPDIDTALLGSFGVGQGAYLIKKAVLPSGAG